MGGWPKEGLSSRVCRGGRGRRSCSRRRRRCLCLCRSSVVLRSGIVTRQAPVWARQLGRDSRLGRERFGVSGTPWFLCESKTTAQLRWGPDGARIVAHLVRAPWQGVAVHGWAPKSKAGNASKAPGSVQKPPVGFDVRVVGRGSSGNLWREHRRCLGFGGWIQTCRGGPSSLMRRLHSERAGRRGGDVDLGASLLSRLIWVWVWVFEKAPVPLQTVELGGLLGAGGGSMQTGLAGGNSVNVGPLGAGPPR